MADMNKFFVIGRLGKDASPGETKSGSPYLTFSIACDRQPFGEQKEVVTDWFFCKMYGQKRVAALQQYLVKGKQVAVDGRIETYRRDDESTGSVVVISDIQLLGGKGNQSPGNSYNEEENSAPTADEDEFPF
jgi:single-strand DNA-binding protein